MSAVGLRLGIPGRGDDEEDCTKEKMLRGGWGGGTRSSRSAMVEPSFSDPVTELGSTQPDYPRLIKVWKPIAQASNDFIISTKMKASPGH